MGIWVCPNCHERVPISNHIGDIVHKCNPAYSSTAVTNESVPVVGPWKDFTGSSLDINSVSQQRFAGVTNTIQGTTADVTNKEKVGNLNSVGQNKGTMRRRQHYQYADLTKYD